MQSVYRRIRLLSVGHQTMLTCTSMEYGMGDSGLEVPLAAFVLMASETAAAAVHLIPFGTADTMIRNAPLAVIENLQTHLEPLIVHSCA